MPPLSILRRPVMEFMERNPGPGTWAPSLPPKERARFAKAVMGTAVMTGPIRPSKGLTSAPTTYPGRSIPAGGRQQFPLPQQSTPDPFGNAVRGVLGQGCGFFDTYSTFAGDLCRTFGVQYVTDWICKSTGQLCDQATTSGSAADPSNLVDQSGPTCPEGQIRIGQNCVDIGAAPPGGDPFISTAGGVAVMGAYGAAVKPLETTRRHLKCPPGMVLGKRDELCYEKAILPRRSQFRKWKGAKRPPVSVRDAQAIRRAENAKGRVKKLAKNVGFTVKRK